MRLLTALILISVMHFAERDSCRVNPQPEYCRSAQ